MKLKRKTSQAEELIPDWEDMDAGQLFVCTQGFTHMVVGGSDMDAQKQLVHWCTELGPHLTDESVYVERLLQLEDLEFMN
jgi:hypothetical protein